ncbi:hypothetical protein F544_17570 [Bibersteinia trehalosi USDA-ARS-USMARC-190]|uniref:Transferrin-binding protein B C-lobe/N-lobe beta-barrel domain-containing protein n=1 Tax=Bibersteinia trehalosi USDA-ARS-USMARC-190 TaxID=1263832 RepID=W0R9J6_BIBTR|nr:transferrin-binding protein-like solute binding protein [Bibersteinia trehalosi]AHG86985.1 hypothetical protein F544_17570 [Bibersteinia trehalosi USDA-ARS-USMARC-190]
MKTLKLTVLSLSLILISCSSGGGGGAPAPASASSQPTATASNQPSSNSPSNPATDLVNDSEQQDSQTPPTTASPKPVHGYYLVGAKRDNVGITAFTLTSDRLEILDHFGGSIPLSDPTQSPADGYYKIGKGIVNDNSLLKETKFGVVENDRQVYIFSQGNRATGMPVSGTASYTGEAILVAVDKEDEFKRLNYFTTPVKFNADFGQKQLIGSLQLMELGADGNVVFDAEINGDKFSKWGGFDGIQVDGAFYGNNASELGGVLLKRDAFSGSFGAKKDD